MNDSSYIAKGSKVLAIILGTMFLTVSNASFAQHFERGNDGEWRVKSTDASGKERSETLEEWKARVLENENSKKWEKAARIGAVVVGAGTVVWYFGANHIKHIYNRFFLNHPRSAQNPNGASAGYHGNNYPPVDRERVRNARLARFSLQPPPLAPMPGVSEGAVTALAPLLSQSERTADAPTSTTGTDTQNAVILEAVATSSRPIRKGTPLDSRQQATAAPQDGAIPVFPQRTEEHQAAVAPDIDELKIGKLQREIAIISTDQRNDPNQIKNLVKTYTELLSTLNKNQSRLISQLLKKDTTIINEAVDGLSHYCRLLYEDINLQGDPEIVTNNIKLLSELLYIYSFVQSLSPVENLETNPLAILITIVTNELAGYLKHDNGDYRTLVIEKLAEFYSKTSQLEAAATPPTAISLEEHPTTTTAADSADGTVDPTAESQVISQALRVIFFETPIKEERKGLIDSNFSEKRFKMVLTLLSSILE